MTIKNLLTIKQVCELLGCKPTKVYKLMKEKKLLALKLGYQTRFQQSDVAAFIASLSQFGGDNTTPEGA